jgi:hypothetical protein
MPATKRWLDHVCKEVSFKSALLRDPLSRGFARGRPTRRRGACAAFVDPDLRAVNASPVWLPEVASTVFRLAAIENDAASGLYVPVLRNAEHILLDTAGRQHVVLRAAAGSFQLTITGARGVVAPKVLALLIRSSSDIAVAARQLAKLHGMLSTAAASSYRPPQWSAQSKRLRDAMIALDGRRAGATLREIAAVIYGKERVARDWPGAGLKTRIQRDFQRGLALCNGAYRSLLA